MLTNTKLLPVSKYIFIPRAAVRSSSQRAKELRSGRADVGGPGERVVLLA